MLYCVPRTVLALLLLPCLGRFLLLGSIDGPRKGDELCAAGVAEHRCLGQRRLVNLLRLVND